jgi:hypothetical protein
LHLLVSLPDHVRLEVHIVHVLRFLLLVQPLNRFRGCVLLPMGSRIGGGS